MYNLATSLTTIAESKLPLSIELTRLTAQIKPGYE